MTASIDRRLERRCGLYHRLSVAVGGPADYEKLARHHYRGDHPGVFAAVYVLKPKRPITGMRRGDIAGVICYTMPSPGNELRRLATARMFAGLDRATSLAMLNRNVRCISRVIIEPRFRCLGLASRLVRETMPLPGRPIIEAMSVMGSVHPFFERAGMQAFTGPPALRCVRMVEAFAAAGIGERLMIDPPSVQRMLDAFEPAKRGFIEAEMLRFLQSYGRRRDMPPGLERTRYVLSKLTERAVYYIWRNPAAC